MKTDRLYDDPAERAVIGAMLLRESTVDEVGRHLDASDFGRPSHQRIYLAIQHLYASGVPIDASTVAARLRDTGDLDNVGGPQALISLQTGAPVARSVESHGRRVVEKAAARRLTALASQAINDLTTGSDVAATVEAIETGISGLGHGEFDTADPLVTIEAWAESGDLTPWVIPGLLRSDWRLMVTAPEGAGKATLLRQIAYAASCGIQPFSPDGERFHPVRSLIVDLENPASTARATVRMMARAAGPPQLGDETSRQPCLVWSREAGIDVLGRRDRSALEAQIRKARPALVLIGPLYKLYRKDSRRQSDDIAEEVCSILDDLRTRYGFALMIEHHSAKGSTDLSPFGSSVWSRWPEIGKTLRPIDDDERRLAVGRFRIDRAGGRWPMAFHRSKGWPFEAVWPSTRFNDEG
jgi:replicative DNA helicase